MATYHHHFYKRFQCETSEDRIYADRKDPEKAEIGIQALRKKKGCGVIDYEKEPLNDAQWPYYEYYSCLCHDNFQFAGFFDIYEVFQNFEKGIMPYSGGIMEQPSLLIEIIVLIRRLDNLRKVEEHKEAERERARQSQKR